MRQARRQWRVAPLDSKVHDRSAFACGAPELDRYIRELASQDVRRDVARVFVALQGDAPIVRGYYSLSATSFRKDDLPAELARRLPRYPVPAALLGRLAVDRSAQGQGLGAYQLMDALDRVQLASRTLAVHAIVVDARDDTAAAFYRKYDFIPLASQPTSLVLPMATIRRLIEGR